MRVRKILASGRSGFAAALCIVLLPECADALPNSSGMPGTQPNAAGQSYNPLFALAPGFAPAIGGFRFPDPPSSTYRSLAVSSPYSDDPASPSLDIGDYDVMWDNMWFSEMAAYGGLERDTLRVAGMRTMDGPGAVPYGRLTLGREFMEGQNYLGLGAYGLTTSVQPTAISGFGNDSYTDMALDGTWRWTAHPERSASESVTVHALVLHEGEDLIASHAIFGTNSSDELVVFRTDASFSWGGNLVPTVQFFRVGGSADPVRLGTPDGRPDSKGWITEIAYLPSDNAHSPLNWFNMRLSLEFVAYSEFDGTSHNAAHCNTVLFHLTADSDAS